MRTQTLTKPLGPRPEAVAISSTQGGNAHWFAISGLIVSAMMAIPSIARPTLLMEPYWVDFCLVNYQDGYRRRALIGSLWRLLFPGGLNVVAINGFSLLITLALLTLLFLAIRHSLRQDDTRSRFWVFALFASAFTSIFFEVTGDMLQIAMLLLCIVMLLLAPRLRHPAARLLLGLATLSIGFLIHEASVFFLPTALPFFLSRRPRLRDMILPLVLIIPLLAVAQQWSNRQGHPTYPVLLRSGDRYLPPAAAAPSLQTELMWETNLNFGSRVSFHNFVRRIVQITLFALALALVGRQITSRETFERILFPTLVIFGISLPLWTIAHDWGRFLAYAIFLAIVSQLAWPRQAAQDAPEPPRLIRWLAGRLEKLIRIELLTAGVAALLLTSPAGWNHFIGITWMTAMQFTVVAAASLILDRFGGEQPGQAQVQQAGAPRE
jgi:hypothetical protein